MAKSEFAVLRMLPNSPEMGVAQTGLENIKDAKAAAIDLAMKNREIVFIPAVLYEPIVAKTITSYQITEPPQSVKALLGFAKPPEADEAPAVAPTDNKPNDGDDKPEDTPEATPEKADGKAGDEVVAPEPEATEPEAAEPEAAATAPEGQEEASASQPGGALF